eukprot:GABV01001715.1.p1 GENE.GABV01001715.1~~GABV01001715.1.p1  ORF type:complete len:105 (+),score=9.31 GABV01001715.1:68-382(+)
MQFILPFGRSSPPSHMHRAFLRLHNIGPILWLSYPPTQANQAKFQASIETHALLKNLRRQMHKSSVGTNGLALNASVALRYNEVFNAEIKRANQKSKNRFSVIL